MEIENLSRKLLNLYSGNPSKEPTPNQTQKIISKNQFITDLSEVTGIKDKYVLEKAFFPKGKSLTYKAKNFIDSLEEFEKLKNRGTCFGWEEPLLKLL